MAGQVISRLTSSGGNDAGVHVISSSFYGVCYTAADEVNKEIIIQNRNVSRIEFTKGMLLAIKFINKNDATSSLPTFQLFKNNSAPNSIPSKGEALANAQPVFAQQDSNIKPTWSAGSVVTFVYDTYTKQNQDGTFSTVGCWIKTAGISEEIFENLNVKIDNVESASTIAINNVTQRVAKVESDVVQAAVVGDIEFIYWPMDSTETPPVTPAASYDWEETFNVECEWTTDTLPYIFGLDIWQRTKSFTIGNASNPSYSDPIRISGRDGAKGDKGDQGEPGTTGSPAYSYNLVTDVTSLTRNVNTSPVVNNPSSIIFSATKTEGNNAPISYSGQLVVSEYIYDNSTSKWIWRQLREKSLMNNQSIEITPSIAATLVRGILFTVDGATQLDSQTVPIIETGLNGEDGKNAPITYLTNESHGFAATSSAAITASVSSQFIVNQDGQELQATIEGISADPLTLPAVTAGALTTTYAGNTFTISINPNFTTTAYSHSGTFSISATASVNGSSQEFTKDFSWSLIPAGADGENGVNVSNVKLYKIAMSAPGKPTDDITYNFNDQTVTGSLNGWSISVPDMSTATAGASCYLISANVLAPANQNTDVIKANEWNGPITYTKNGKDGTNGTNGLDAYNRASISLYQRSSTTPAEPSSSINYTFSTGTLTPSDVLGSWTTGVTAATDGEPCWVINATAISNSAVYTITDWSNPVIFTRDGADGEGVSITNREIHYIESDSGTVTPANDAQWETTIPSVAEGNYLWTRTKVTYSDENALTSYSVAKQGEGITVTGSSIEYATNNSTTTPTSGWQNTPPSTTPGWYIWTKTTTNYSDGSAVTSYSVGKTGTNGSNAYLYELHCSPSVIMFDQNATTPAFAPTSVTLSATRTDGNSIPAAYAGRFKLEWSNNNSTWTAVATNGNSNVSSWTQSIASVNTAATSFKATLYAANSATNVLDTETIPVIRGGKNGINGYNQSTVYLYIRSDSNTQPTKPSNSHTYNFANKTFTDATDNKIENWTINRIPAADGDKVVWMTFAVASSTASTDEIASTEWSTPVKIEGVDGQQGQPGADGYNQTVVQLYQRYDSQPTKPANNSLTYTFNTNKITGSLNGWSQQIPASNGQPCWITVGIARSQGSSDVIDSWSDPVIYNKDGTDGYNKATIYLYKRTENIPTEENAKPSGELTYTFETETLTPASSLNGWSQEIPTTDTTLWMIAAVANSTNSTDAIGTNDWSTPIQMEGINGQPGENGFNQATIDLYKRADSAPTSMPGELTYTFGATNPLSTPQNNWSQTIPATNGQPCWVTSGTAVSRNTSARISNWSTPTKMLEDSINVVIDNDNVTFPTTNGAATKTTVTCNIKAFKGLTQVPCTIGDISGTVTGVTTSKTNGTTTTPTAKVTITASNTTSTLLTTEQGTLTIPITISGVTNSINKQFTWSLAKNGLNQATIYLYKRANTATKPSSGNDSVYNFTDKTLTNIPSGWSTAFPEETQGSTTPVWVMTAVASSNTNTDNIAYTEWSTPVRYVSSGSNGQPGKDGEDAYNQADIFLYRRSVDAPAKPVFSNFTYTFSTGVSGLTTSYTTNASPSVTWYTSVTAATVTSGNSKNDYMPCWMTTTHPVSQSASVTVTNTWSDPAIFIQPGKGIVDITEYYLATTASMGITTASSGWETSLSNAQISSTNKYLWNYEVTTYTDTNTRTIAPHIIATYGEKGNTGKGISSIANYYQTTETATAPSSRYESTTTPNGWTQCPPGNIPQVTSTNKYLWNYEKVTYTEGDPTFTNIHLVGAYGDNGVGIRSIEEQQILWPYDDSDTSTHPGPGDNANWQPKGSVIWESGKYIWNQTKIEWTNGNIDYVGRAVAKDINDLNEKMQLTDTGSGTVVTSDDAAPLPPLSLIIYGKSMQDGTPSLSAPVPIISIEEPTIIIEDSNGTVISSTTINLQDHALRSLPDGTRDELRMENGTKMLTQRCGETQQAITDGVSGTVGVDVLSSTGEIVDGAQVIYKLTEPQTISIGTIDIPPLPSSFSMYVDAEVTPSIDAEWWTTLGYETGKQHITANSLLASLSSEITENQETVKNNAIIETKQLWFITDRYGNDDFELRPPRRIIGYTENTETTPPTLTPNYDNGWEFNTSTGDYDNWASKIPNPYITLNSINWVSEVPNPVNDIALNSNNPNDPSNNRYTFSKNNDVITIKDTVIRDKNDNPRDVTEYCIIKKNEKVNEADSTTIISYSIQKYYPYNYYCYEYKYMDGSIKYSENVFYDSVKSSIAQNKIVEEAQNEILRQMIESQNQYFYSDANGAHVEDINSKYRTDWNSFGMSFYKQYIENENAENEKKYDAKLLTIFASSDNNSQGSGMTIYNGKTGDEGKIIAQFTPGLIQLGSDEDPNRLSITPSAIRFFKDNTDAAYIENSQFYAPNITIDSSLYLKTPSASIDPQYSNENYEWAWIPRSNGNLSLKWTGTSQQS